MTKSKFGRIYVLKGKGRTMPFRELHEAFYVIKYFFNLVEVVLVTLIFCILIVYLNHCIRRRNGPVC